MAASQQGTKTQAGKILLEAFSEKLSNLDKAQIRGEYKLWIYKRYLTQSIRFFLSVNPIPSTYISKMQKMGMKLLKKWLGLTRSTSIAVIHHPDILVVPHLPQLQTKAKLTYLSSVICADDPLIQELTKSCLDEATAEHRGISRETLSIFHQARESVSSIISRKTLPRECTKITNERDKCHWNCTLESLTDRGSSKTFANLNHRTKYGTEYSSVCRLASCHFFFGRVQTPYQHH